LSSPHNRSPNLPSLFYLWETWTRGGDEWNRISVKSTECARIKERFLEWQRRRMGDRAFRREYLCEFMDTRDTLFQREVLERAINGNIRPLWTNPITLERLVARETRSSASGKSTTPATFMSGSVARRQATESSDLNPLGEMDRGRN
jgi:hypothetical protein